MRISSKKLDSRTRDVIDALYRESKEKEDRIWGLEVDANEEIDGYFEVKRIGDSGNHKILRIARVVTAPTYGSAHEPSTDAVNLFFNKGRLTGVEDVPTGYEIQPSIVGILQRAVDAEIKRRDIDVLAGKTARLMNSAMDYLDNPKQNNS